MYVENLPTALRPANASALSKAILYGPSAPADPLSWEAVSAVARIVVTPDDGPIRTIVTGRRRIVTGFYVSSKAGRSQPFEGMNEHAFYMHCEVDPGRLAVSSASEFEALGALSQAEDTG